MIIVAVTLSACLAGALAALIAAFTGWLRDRQRLSESRVDATEKAGTIAVQASSIVILTTAVATEKRRANAFEDALYDAASGDVVGARDRVLRRLQEFEARGDTRAAGDSPRTVHPEPATEVVPLDREGLIAPGD